VASIFEQGRTRILDDQLKRPTAPERAARIGRRGSTARPRRRGALRRSLRTALGHRAGSIGTRPAVSPRFTGTRARHRIAASYRGRRRWRRLGSRVSACDAIRHEQDRARGSEHAKLGRPRRSATWLPNSVQQSHIHAPAHSGLAVGSGANGHGKRSLRWRAAAGRQPSLRRFDCRRYGQPWPVDLRAEANRKDTRRDWRRSC